ncbi:hypothetical protein [Streptomyces sp. NPDC048361]|uniref:hypothetical protein n=1 Tax=Streptomyces sp. NPDC048361 TaxID=3154720 RepID=UPI0034330A79
MVGLILLGVLVLVVAGCVCVVWSSRGGPRWVRAVASLTLAAGDVVRGADRKRKRRRSLNGNPSGEG